MLSRWSKALQLVRAASVIIVLAAGTGACSGAPDQGSSQGSGNAGSGGLTANDLLSAPVPAACGHKAGRLVNGVQTGIPQNHGSMQLAWLGEGTSARMAFTAFGNLTVLDCNAGGVAWPQIIAFYSQGTALLAWSYLTGFNLPGKEPGENTDVRRIMYRDGGIAVDWSTQDEGDAAARPTLDYSAVLRLSGGKVVATGLTGTTEFPTAEAFTRDLRKGDESAASALAAPGLGLVAATQFRNYPSALTAAPKCYGMNDFFTMPPPLAALIDVGSSTQVQPLPDRVCALASSDPGANWVVLGMRHIGFRQWQVIWMHTA
jgi:hypothetical protein